MSEYLSKNPGNQTEGRAERPSLTDMAKRVMTAAERIAMESGAGHIGTEQILLAMAADQGVAGMFLQENGITPEKIKAFSDSLMGEKE